MKRINHPEHTPQRLDKRPALVADLDGTLALMVDRKPLDWHRVHTDAPHLILVDMLRRYTSDHCILIVSGRSMSCHQETVEWLDRYSVPYCELHMREEGDYRKDAILKQEIWERHIRDHYEVAFCLDDRNQSVAFWRGLGLVVLQVAPGDF